MAEAKPETKHAAQLYKCHKIADLFVCCVVLNSPPRYGTHDNLHIATHAGSLPAMARAHGKASGVCDDPDARSHSP